MFEVYGRHAPMFTLSAVKKITGIFIEVLGFSDTELHERGMVILPMTQTVRINEINQFIIKSALTPENILVQIEEISSLQRLRNARSDASQLIADVIMGVVKKLEVDSCLCFGGALPSGVPCLPPATRDAKKPLVIFNTLKQTPTIELVNPDWQGMDHHALWIGRNWLPVMEGMEAFFAMSPELKLEVGLNHYRPLACFGDFAVGMVRF